MLRKLASVSLRWVAEPFLLGAEFLQWTTYFFAFGGENKSGSFLFTDVIPIRGRSMCTFAEFESAKANTHGTSMVRVTTRIGFH
jgi:hypothetical protein